MLTNEDRAEIQARADAATEGPWEWTPLESQPRQELHGPESGVLRTSVLLHPAKADAEFIAHARADIPKLLAELTRMERQDNTENGAVVTSGTVGDGDLIAGIFNEARDELTELRAERDAALAVIEQVRTWFADADDVFPAWNRVEAILATSPPDALDAVKAAAWGEGYWLGINGHTGPGNPYRDSGAVPAAEIRTPGEEDR